MWTQNVDCVAVSTRPLTAWSLATLNWLELNISTATTRQLHACNGRSAKSLALRWRNDGMSMNPRLSPRMTASLFCAIDRIDTDRTIPANRPDIALKNEKDKTYLLIDMTCTPRHQHLSQNHGKAYQIQRLGNRGWANMGAQNNNSPGGYGSPWHHQEGHRKLLQRNPWQRQHTWELQKITLLFTAHLLERVLSIK